MAILLVVDIVTSIFAAIWPRVDAVSMHCATCKTAFVDTTIQPAEFATALVVIAVPLAFVAITVRINVSAAPCSLVIQPVALV